MAANKLLDCMDYKTIFHATRDFAQTTGKKREEHRDHILPPRGLEQYRPIEADRFRYLYTATRIE